MKIHVRSKTADLFVFGPSELAKSNISRFFLNSAQTSVFFIVVPALFRLISTPISSHILSHIPSHIINPQHISTLATIKLDQPIVNLPPPFPMTFGVHSMNLKILRKFEFIHVTAQNLHSFHLNVLDENSRVWYAG